jgi:hypothetical protein
VSSPRRDPVRDLRRYAAQTNTRLAVGAGLLLFLVGDGLILAIFGPGPALMGLLCLAAGLTPILLIVLILWGIDRIVDRANQE